MESSNLPYRYWIYAIFLPTLESPFNKKINAIYVATLCMAWKEIQDTIGSNISTCESKALTLMTNSKSYQHVLEPNEYKTSIEVIINPETKLRQIKAMAYFKKGLPFEDPLSRYENGVSYMGNNVTAFGFRHRGPASIMYYNNDDDFAIKLYPKDDNHEIILIKSSFHINIVLNEEIKKLEKQTKIFKENRSTKNAWKYKLNDEDKVGIPIISFHLEYAFKDIIGTVFELENGIPFYILQFYQKNAFILDEKGALVESYVEAVAEELCEPLEQPVPKNLIFDKPYIILLKRENSIYPYFAMYVGNSELMVKEN